MALFIKFDGIDGEASDGSIEVLSFSWGMTNDGGGRGNGGGGGSGRVNVQDLNFTKHTDKTSPLMMLQCATGKHIKKAVLTLRKAGGDGVSSLLPAVQFEIELADVMVSAYTIKGEQKADVTGSELPTETLSLNFSKIEVTDFFQDPTGAFQPVTASFDVKSYKAG